MARDTICFLQMCTGHMRKDLKNYPNCSTLFETKHWTRDNILWQEVTIIFLQMCKGQMPMDLKTLP